LDTLCNNGEEERDKSDFLKNLNFWDFICLSLIFPEYVSCNRRGKSQSFLPTFHEVRYTFGSRLCVTGQNLKTIMEIMGHRTHKMAMRCQHPTPDHKLRTAKILDGYFANPKSEEVVEFNR